MSLQELGDPIMTIQRSSLAVSRRTVLASLGAGSLGLALAVTARSAASQTSATPSPGAADDNVLLEVPLPAEVVPGDGFGTAGVRFFVMAPESTATWSGEMSDQHPGVWVHYVLAGAMTVTADAAVDVIRGDGRRETIRAGTEIALAPGDASLHRMGKALEWKSTGSAEVQIVSLYVAGDNIATGPYLPSNQWRETGFGSVDTMEIPPGDWLLSLEVHELQPDEMIAAPASPSLQFGVPGPGTDAMITIVGEGDLILRATNALPVYVFTFEWLGESAATPQP